MRTDSDTDADTDSDSDVDTDPSGGTGQSVPDFQADVVPIFGRSCGAGDNSCHSAVAYAANAPEGCKGWLALEDRPLGATYNGNPTGCPDRSLYDRLVDLGSEVRQPWFAPGQLPLAQDRRGWHPLLRWWGRSVGAHAPTSTLDPADLRTIERWIAAGAPR